MAAATAKRATTTMRHLDLREYEPSPPVRLAVAERDALRRSLRPVTIEPAPDSENTYILTPGATIGALEIGHLSVSIRGCTSDF